MPATGVRMTIGTIIDGQTCEAFRTIIQYIYNNRSNGVFVFPWRTDNSASLFSKPPTIDGILSR